MCTGLPQESQWRRLEKPTLPLMDATIRWKRNGQTLIGRWQGLFSGPWCPWGVIKVDWTGWRLAFPLRRPLLGYLAPLPIGAAVRVVYRHDKEFEVSVLAEDRGL